MLISVSIINNEGKLIYVVSPLPSDEKADFDRRFKEQNVFKFYQLVPSARVCLTSGCSTETTGVAKL